MPSGAHPWMNPDRDTKLWPHGDDAIYRAYDRIFGCQGHGWSNLQSMHINLPFKDDAEFGRLHAAIRVVLPLLPALAASTPFLDGKNTGLIDARIDTYARNQRSVPSITGRVIPEPVRSRRAISGGHSRTDVSRHRAARSGRHPAVRVAELARRHRAFRSAGDRNPPDRRAGTARRGSGDRGAGRQRRANDSIEGRTRCSTRPMRSTPTCSRESCANVSKTAKTRASTTPTICACLELPMRSQRARATSGARSRKRRRAASRRIARRST